MAVESSKAVYGNYLEQKGEINCLTDTLKVALLGENVVFDPDKHKAWTAPQWQASEPYSQGDIVIPTTPNGRIYLCTTAGTSDGTEPSSWDTAFGNTVSDGTVTWTCWSYNTIEEEITRENGYTAPVAMTNMVITENEAGNYSEIKPDNVEIVASGGSFGPTASAIIFVDTHAHKPVYGFISFGSVYTPLADEPIILANIRFRTTALQGVIA